MNIRMLTVIVACIVISCDRRPSNFENGDASLSLSKAPHQKMEVVKSSQVIARKLIRNGQISFSTKNLEDTRTALEKVCKDFDAYVYSEEQQKFDETIRIEQVIRIPSSRFDSFLKVVEKLGNHIDYRNVTTQDVTEEFIDIEARLRTKKELELRYHQLLQKAGEISDMLSIEGQIADVRSQIEKMEGRMNYLVNQVSYSTLTLTFSEEVVTNNGYGARVASSFISGWNGLLGFIVGVTAAWPAILILCFFVWFVRRWARLTATRTSKSSPGT